MTRLTWILAATLTGCLHPAAPEYSGTVRVDSAELIPVNPDVKVVADAEKPMFFVRGSYWMFHDAAWYRAPSIHGTFVQVKKPPVPVLQIDQPYAFVHFRKDPPLERTAALEIDNTTPSTQKPSFKFQPNPLAFE